MATLIAKDEDGNIVDPFNLINEVFFEGISFGRIEQRMHDGEPNIIWTIRTARQSRIYSMAEIFGYDVKVSHEDVHGAVFNLTKLTEEQINDTI